MRVALVGAVHASAVALRVLLQFPSLIVKVWGLDPTRRSRHADYCDLTAAARELGVASESLISLRDEASLDALRTFSPDVVCIFGWSQIVGDSVLSIPRIGTLGWHPSLLPLNRGRAVIPWTILQGAEKSGASIFWIDSGMDTGDIAAQVEYEVDARETAASLYQKFEVAAERAVARVFRALTAGERPRVKQDHSKATICALRRPEDAKIDWCRSAAEIDRLIRASGTPYAGAFFYYRGAKYTVESAVPAPASRFWGLPGQIQSVSGSGVVVKCGDGEDVIIEAVASSQGTPVVLEQTFKVHERLNG